MDISTICSILFSTLFCGGAVALIQHKVSKKSLEREEYRKERELKLREDNLKLEQERQRIEDLPNIQFGSTSFSYPLSYEHGIEIVNTGEVCKIIKIGSNIAWRLIQPQLPFTLNKGNNIVLRFILPKNDPVLTKTFPQYTINIYVKDRHEREYLFALKARGNPSNYLISIEAPILVKTN